MNCSRPFNERKNYKRSKMETLRKIRMVVRGTEENNVFVNERSLICPQAKSMILLETYLADAKVIFLHAGFSTNWQHINTFKTKM